MNRYTSRSEDETVAIGRAVAAALPAGSVLLLHGDLGAGKTALVRGLALGLGLDADEVSSPTFTLVHEYRGGRVPLFHADLYRLPPGASVEDLGLDEAADEGILAVEWPERLARQLAGAVHVRITITGESTRDIAVAEAEADDHADGTR